PAVEARSAKGLLSGPSSGTGWHDDIGESQARLATASESAKAVRHGAQRPASAATSVRRTGHSCPYQEGLGLSGGGAGGGGIGLGYVGALGHGIRRNSGSERRGGSHQMRAAHIRVASVTVDGRLPQEVVQRIARQNFGRFRLCYERGLARNPNLTGKVEVDFTIDASGAVRASSATARSTLPDFEVRSCVSEAFYTSTFPPQESGSATVMYSIFLGAEEPSSAVPSAAQSSGVLGTVGHTRLPCGPGAQLPFDERVALWRER